MSMLLKIFTEKRKNLHFPFTKEFRNPLQRYCSLSSCRCGRIWLWLKHSPLYCFLVVIATRFFTSFRMTERDCFESVLAVRDPGKTQARRSKRAAFYSQTPLVGQTRLALNQAVSFKIVLLFEQFTVTTPPTDDTTILPFMDVKSVVLPLASLIARLVT